MSRIAELPDSRYDAVHRLAFVGQDCLLASFAASCLDADTSLEALRANNASVLDVCNWSASVVQDAGWTTFEYKSCIGYDGQEWPVANKRQALVFMATLDNISNEDRSRCYRMLCAAMRDDSKEDDGKDEDDLENMQQVRILFRKCPDAWSFPLICQSCIILR